APATGWAHPAGGLQDGAAVAAWTFDAPLILGLGFATALYGRGATRLWSRDAGRRVLPRWRAAACAGGLVALAVALLSPVESLSGAMLSAHMLQHVLLMSIAAPLLVLGAPTRALVSGLPV